MKSIDDLIKELYKDDPDGYEQHLQKRKNNKIKFEKKLQIERKLATKLLSQPSRNSMEFFIGKLSNDELLTLHRQFKYSLDCVETQHHENLNNTIFSKSKTTFKDIVIKYSWKDVQEKLFNLFPDQQKNVNRYEHVFLELKRLEKETNKDNSVIILKTEIDTYDDSEYLSVSSVKPNDLSTYAIEFCRWEEWLGFYCNQEDLDKHGELKFLSHCLWEMTFCGFTQEDVQEEVEELKRRAEDVENYIEDQKNNSDEF